ncbi:aspartyl-phosphate phosphatase Spo0E family protein [Paenibacillus sp. N3.4]|nr:aspartyl-phosphate phosphatase Spo0E family protein [Paenibacillus sp. N3.4]
MEYLAIIGIALEGCRVVPLYEIEKKIEDKRKELNQASNHYDLLSDFILKLSHELDELLNRYDNLCASN